MFSEVLWSTGSTEESIYATDEGNYYAQVTDKFGCKSNSNSIYIKDMKIQLLILPIMEIVLITRQFFRTIAHQQIVSSC